MDREWVRRLTQGLDMEGESLPGMTVAELAGDQRILVEGHRGVTEYSPCRVTVRVGYGTLSVYGCGLQLRQMSKAQLVVCGRIDGIEVRRKRDGTV